MKSHCLPFRQVPHSTRLFLDYLEYAPPVQQFYPRSARFLEWAQDEVSRIQYPPERRVAVADILERQNKAWGASQQTLENIGKFRGGACAVVTGQQVGIFGGPVFSIYKALSAVKLAEEARKLGIDCVPIFWLATEDHDLEEVNQIGIPGPEGGLARLAATVAAAPDSPVGRIAFGPEISETIAQATALLGPGETSELIAECYRPGETFGTAFARLFTRLFGDFGVVLLDGSDPELDWIASPLYRYAIENAEEFNKALIDRDLNLRAAEYHQQVKVTDSSTLLFRIRDGARVPVHMSKPGTFLIGTEEFSEKQLLADAASAPDSFSPNVLLRPVVQDYVLPTLAYIGGAAEVAYFAQVAVVYEKLVGRTTPILPRFSATLIEQKPQALLEKYRLNLPEVFQGPEALRETIASHLLPPKLQSSFDQATAAVEQSMKLVKESIAKLDKTLLESAENAESKMVYQVSNLRSRAARAELRQAEVLGRHSEILSNSLYPEKTLQEREYGGLYFLAKHSKGLLNELLETIHPDCLDHQVITL